MGRSELNWEEWGYHCVAGQMAMAKQGNQQGSYTISCVLKSTQRDFTRCFTRIYKPHTNPEREDLWHEFAAIRGLWNEQWLTEKAWLETSFEEDEVLDAVNSCAPNKSLGPDGFTMAFY
ncbi:hypothetical protein H5410_064323 [Solanum commersonii]|uniref:Uncharacterized protein n=1 Tax=Solanum commersonii TaxID=4109 RepID=A0A9J5VZU7_SOLCO|nr:hypothetical protein H5410_064323 [Solanum commersonii]